MVNEEKKIPYCRRCGRKLKTEEAINRGMGKICWQKSYTSEEKRPLFKEVKDSAKSCP